MSLVKGSPHAVPRVFRVVLHRLSFANDVEFKLRGLYSRDLTGYNVSCTCSSSSGARVTKKIDRPEVHPRGLPGDLGAIWSEFCSDPASLGTHHRRPTLTGFVFSFSHTGAFYYRMGRER